MFRFIARRVTSALPVLFIVSVVVFGLMHLTPGDPAAIMLGPEASPAAIESLRESLGLNQPPLLQYAGWLWGALSGDLGESIFLNRSVGSAIADQIRPTFFIAIVAQTVALLIAVPAGIFAARRQGRPADMAVISSAVVGTSLPSFLLGLLLILVFAVWLGILPSGGYVPPGVDGVTSLRHIILPAASLAVLQAALIARMTRTTMIDVLHQNFITVGRARGLSERSITFKHALRNSALPILTVAAQSFGLLISGAIVIETVFNIPGLGQLTINAISRRDYPVIQGVVLVVACIYVAVNLVVDILYGILDPRVRVTT